MSFNPNNVNLNVLRERAYNLRWAAQPEGVIPLTAADPDFECSDLIVRSINEYIAEGYFSYSPAEGLPEFKQAMHDFLLEKRDFCIDPHLILPVNSAAFGIYLVCKTFLKPGDEAIIFDPVDFLFQYSIREVGGTAVRFPIAADQRSVDFDAMKPLITSRTKLICLCNPLNPTGKVFTAEELIQLGEIAIEHDLIILSDEIWSDIVFDPNRFVSIGGLSKLISEKVVLVTGFSKSYGLAGLRIGVVATSNEILFDKLFKNSLHESTINGVSSLGQIAAKAALENGQSWLDSFLLHLTEMRDLVTNSVNQISGLKAVSPDGCYVSLIDIRDTRMSSEQFQQLVLNKAKVALVPGLSEWFGPGAEGYVRLSFATSKEILEEALHRIKKEI